MEIHTTKIPSTDSATYRQIKVVHNADIAQHDGGDGVVREEHAVDKRPK